MKTCPRCGQSKDEGEFYAEPKRSGGLSSLCKECKRENNRLYWRERYYPAHAKEQKAAVIARRRKLKESGTTE